MPPPLLQAQRDEIEHLIRTDGCTSRIVCATNVSKAQIDKMKRNLARHGVVVAPSAPRGRPPKLTEEMEAHLLEYIKLHSTKYLDEMCWFLLDMYDVTVSEATVCRILKSVRGSQELLPKLGGYIPITFYNLTWLINC